MQRLKARALSFDYVARVEEQLEGPADILAAPQMPGGLASAPKAASAGARNSAGAADAQSMQGKQSGFVPTGSEWQCRKCGFSNPNISPICMACCTPRVPRKKK